MSKEDRQFILGEVAHADHRLRDFGIFLFLVILTSVSGYLASTGVWSGLSLIFLVITAIFGISSFSKHLLYFISTHKRINNAIDYVKKKPDGVYLVGYFATNFEIYQIGDKQVTKENVRFTKLEPQRM